MSKDPNFLVLDEVTNDLDLQTLTLLENFLLEYRGVLIVVSHDRFFMDRITNHLFVFEGRVSRATRIHFVVPGEGDAQRRNACLSFRVCLSIASIWDWMLGGVLVCRVR